MLNNYKNTCMIKFYNLGVGLTSNIKQSKIATEAEAYAIGGEDTPNGNKACTNARAQALGCESVNGHSSNQLVPKDRLKKDLPVLWVKGDFEADAVPMTERQYYFRLDSVNNKWNNPIKIDISKVKKLDYYIKGTRTSFRLLDSQQYIGKFYYNPSSGWYKGYNELISGSTPDEELSVTDGYLMSATIEGYDVVTMIPIY